MKLDLLGPLDRTAFAAYCQSYARWQECEQVIATRGLMYVTANGRPRERPEVAIARAFAKLAVQFASEFGLTPASRARLALPGTVDDLDECRRCGLDFERCGCPRQREFDD